MNENRENELRTLQLEFFGRILAGFTHDLKNHLAIIQESNGLISDLIAMGMITDEALAAKLQKIVTSIQGRVSQATDMANNLNGFAHRQDTPLSSFQVNDLLAEELTFLRRFTRIREIDLKIELHEGLPAIYNNASLVQYVVFKLFTMALKKLKNHALIEVASGEENSAVKITFRLSGEKEQFDKLIDDESAAAIQEALDRMQARVAQLSQAGDEKQEIGLFVPSLVKA
jgi:K+-sensing histidine kinase KdpD